MTAAVGKVENEKGRGGAGRGLLYIAGAKAWFIVTAYAVYFVLPRLLGSAEAFGLYSTAIQTISIVNNVLIAATVQTVSKLVSEDESRAGATLRQGLGIQLAIGVVAAALMAGLAPLVAEHVLRDPQLTPLLQISATVVFAYSLYAALVGSLNGRQLFHKQATLDITFSALRTFGILLGAGIGMGVLGALAGFASAAVVILLVAMVMVGIGTSGEKLPLSRWTSFMRPIWIYQLFLNGILLVDVLVMKGTLAAIAMDAGANATEAARVASENVGLYSAAQKFAFVPYQLMLSLTFIVFPMVSRATSQGDSEGAKRTIQEAVRFALIVLVCVAAPVAGASSGVLRIAYPEEYVAGAGALGILAMGAAAFALFVITSTALSGAGRPGTAAGITATSFVIVVVGNYALLNFVGIGEHTLEAAALATSIGMVVALLLAAIVVHRQLGGFVAPMTAVRVGVAGTVAFWAARLVQHDTRLLAVVALAAGAAAFFATLIALREVGAVDLTKIRKAIGR